MVATDADGHYSLEAGPRTYTVEVSALGHVTQSLTDVVVNADEEVTIDFSLTPLTRMHLPLLAREARCYGRPKALAF